MKEAVVEISPELLKFARRQLKNGPLGAPDVERRREKRVAVALPVLMQPVDKQLMPSGDLLTAATRDMSAEGLGVIVENYLVKGRLFAARLEIEDEQPCLLVKALWCMPMGPYFYAGLRALKVLDELPLAE